VVVVPDSSRQLLYSGLKGYEFEIVLLVSGCLHLCSFCNCHICTTNLPLCVSVLIMALFPWTMILQMNILLFWQQLLEIPSHWKIWKVKNVWFRYYKAKIHVMFRQLYSSLSRKKGNFYLIYIYYLLIIALLGEWAHLEGKGAKEWCTGNTDLLSSLLQEIYSSTSECFQPSGSVCMLCFL
jgi:hypothetical protein